MAMSSDMSRPSNPISPRITVLMIVADSVAGCWPSHALKRMCAVIAMGARSAKVRNGAMSLASSSGEALTTGRA